jgi:phosphoglycerol transferase MdoB-like AlkP superfamily enzyme
LAPTSSGQEHDRHTTEIRKRRSHRERLANRNREQDTMISAPANRNALASRTATLAPWLAALSFVAIWYLALRTGIELLLGTKIWSDALWRDLTTHLLIGALLFGMAASLARFCLASAALFTALTLANALKLSTLGGPLMPDDFLAARNLLFLLEGWPLVGAVLMVVVPTVLLWRSIAWRRLRTWVNVGAIVLAGGLLTAFAQPVSSALDARFGNSVWNQQDNYASRGLPLHLLQESVRALARREPPPESTEIALALDRLGVVAPQDIVEVGGAVHPGRNLHMIVLESFWDPAELHASQLSADPFDPAFRELWASAGHSRALVPVFGGYTANSEYEALCGFPVERDNVFFETGLRRVAPCLPRHLADAGYRSVASHPNWASFWNRVNAYRRIGFDTYWSDADFALDDMNDQFLSDASLYRQVLERLSDRIQGPTPVFNYVLTYFGHLPYPLNERRPPVVRATEGHETVQAYANAVYYKSRELMDFLRELRRLDPDGVIALFGDHLPALGGRFAGYRESGLLAPEQGEFTDEMFRTLVATPLIVIDGRQGVVRVGDLPLYRLPALLLELLGDRRGSIMALTAADRRTPAIRPLPGMHFVSDGEITVVCRDDARPSAACEASTSWLSAIRLLQRDIFSGKQRALEPADLPRGFTAAARNPRSRDDADHRARRMANSAATRPKSATSRRS